MMSSPADAKGTRKTRGMIAGMKPSGFDRSRPGDASWELACSREPYAICDVGVQNASLRKEVRGTGSEMG